MAKTKREKTVSLRVSEWDRQLHNAREEGYRMGFKVGKDSERRAEEADRRKQQALELKVQLVNAVTQCAVSVARVADQTEIR